MKALPATASPRLGQPAAPCFPLVLAGSLLGGLLFFALGGATILNLHQISWLLDTPDPRTHYLGWCFFRHSPWMLPPGANPRYGLAMGSSIVYSDSIPLMALLCKIVSPWLAEEFQYTGAWLLLTLVLQGACAALLARQVIRSRAAQVLVTAFLLLPSILLQRLNGHYALAAHWPILIALWMYLRPAQSRVRWPWAVLAGLTALIHLYLTVMVLAIWHADLMHRWLNHRRPWPLLREYALVIFSTGAVMWLGGYFLLGFGDTITPNAAGAYAMNLLAPFDPRGASAFLPDIPLEHAGQGEGNCYLGLGLILLGLIAIAAIAGKRGTACDGTPATISGRTMLPLTIMVSALALFAISPKVTLGPWTLVSLPNFWGPLGEVLRASGRMIWPAFYLLTLLILLAIASRFPPRITLLLLAAGLLLQVADLSFLGRCLRQHFQQPPPAPRTLNGAFWEAAAQRRHIEFVPADAAHLDWFPLARFAAAHHMSVNYGYFARYSWDRRCAADQELLSQLRAGRLRGDTLYVLCDASLLPSLCRALPPGVFHFVDGYILIQSS